MLMRRGYRSVGSIVGMVLIAVLVFIALGFSLVIISTFEKYGSLISAMLSERAASLAIAQSIQGWWLLQGGTLTVHLETSYPKTVLLTGVTVLWSDGSTTLMDQGNGTLSSVAITVKEPSGAVHNVAGLPVALGPGYRLNITLRAPAGVEPVSIVASFSASPAVVVIPVRRYVPPSGNVTPAPPPSGNYTSPAVSLQLLPQVLSGYTTATRIYQAVLSPSRVLEPSGYSIVYGTHVSGSLSSLSARDGDTLNIQSSGTVLCPAYTGWRYYREVTVTNPNPYSYTDIQVRIELDTTNFDFNKARSDGSDIRVLTEDCRPLPYWVEEWNTTAGRAVIWVKIPSIQANGRVKILLVYGNPSATQPDPDYYGLEKVMTPLPAGDGPGYTIQYQEWVMPRRGVIPGGTPMGWHADDGAWRYTLPFSFPFYDRRLSSVYVCSNGFISQSRITDWSDSTYELERRLMIAPFWEDLMTSGDAHDIYILSGYSDQYGSGVVIRWHTDFYWHHGVADFDVVLYENGLIRFDYGSINGYSGDRPTIGISLGDRRHYTISSYNNARASSLNNAPSLMFWPRKKPVRELEAEVGPERLFTIHRAGVEISYNTSGRISITGIEVYANDPGSPYSYQVSIISGGVPVYSVEAGNASGPLSISLSGLRIPVEGSFSVRIVVSRFTGFQLQLDLVSINASTVTITGSRIAIASEQSSSLLIYDPASGAAEQVDLTAAGLPGTGATLLAMDPVVRGASTWLWVLRGSRAVPYDLFRRQWLANKTITLGSSIAEGGFAASNGTHLYVYPGGGLDRVYVYSIENGTLVSTIQLPLAPGNYTSTAQAGSILYIHTGEAGRLLALSLSDGRVRDLGPVPALYPVGMDYDPDRGRLWAMLRGGELEYYDLAAGSWSAYPVTAPYYPMSPGDRLVYMDGKLYHVREDGTSSLLVLQLG
ncbi:hypothetical protein CF15_07490 [Pyrodictium occultum]|uniref:DUF2341 domain-containing protein n=2 Tax=Pyrodictium occultum TaxID=2309 RepID=A0A0V8RWX2_PYROC|nr:hypothetical protein CF15_07490 [Pyrodictium occultum]